MSNPNLAKVQALVVAWRFLLPSYSSHLSRHHTRRDLLATSYSLSSLPLVSSLTSYSSLCIVQLPGVSVTLRAALTMLQSSQSYSLRPTCYRPRRRQRAHRHPPHSCRTHRVMLIPLCSSRHAHRVMLIASCSSRRAQRVVLNASCRICQLSFVSARSVVVAYLDVH